MAKASSGKVPSVLPEVQRFTEKYKPKREASASARPAERGLLLLSALDRYLVANPGSRGTADRDRQVELRGLLFKLEAWLRLYRSSIGKPFEKSLETVKELEDQLGAVLLWGEMRHLVDGKKSTPATAHLDGMVAKETKTLDAIVEEDWTPDAAKRKKIPALDKLAGRILDADFGSDEDDTAWLRKRMTKHVDGILEEEWDFTDLQGGIHEIRRQLRWIPLYFQSLGGAVQLDDASNPVPALKALLKTADAKSPFIRMESPAREKDPIVVSKSLVIANSRLIDALGAVKDDGEHVTFLAEIMEKTKMAKGDDALALARKTLGGRYAKVPADGDVSAEADRVWGEFEKQGVLKALRTELRGA